MGNGGSINKTLAQFALYSHFKGGKDISMIRPVELGYGAFTPRESTRELK